MPPIMCPLDPVPGILKLIIWAANTKAPITPIIGMMSVRLLCATFRVATTSSDTAATPAIMATGGDTRASAMCIIIQFYGYLLN